MARNTTADVEVRILGNIHDFAKKMNQAKLETMSLQQKMLALSGIMKNVGRQMTLGITLPVVGGMALSVKAASDLNEEMNKVKVVFGQSSDAVVKFADKGAKALGMSKTEALSAAGAFGNLFKTTGIAGAKAADMSTQLVQLAADMASFNNESPDDMLEKLQSGLVGEARPLRTVGVLLSEARTQEEAYASGIAKRGAVLTDAQKVQARYNLILKDTKVQQGDFARTSDGLANQLRILKASAIDLGASVGTVLLPVVTKLSQAFGTVFDLLERMPKWLQTAGVYVGLFVAAIGPLLGPSAMPCRASER